VRRLTLVAPPVLAVVAVAVGVLARSDSDTAPLMQAAAAPARHVSS
jgi:hypothetical protein